MMLRAVALALITASCASFAKEPKHGVVVLTDSEWIEIGTSGNQGR